MLYGLPKCTVSGLQAVQNSAARIVTHERLRDHDSMSRALMELHWLPVNKRIEYKLLLYTGSSTTICTTLLLETITYYRENRSDCFLLLLDASKAFDRVEYVKLFQTLRGRKICPTVLRLIMHMYVNQKILIRWNQLISQTCAISNGVKQGGVLSPILYSVYVDNLIKILRDSKIGCMYNNEYMGIFTYADDISLIMSYPFWNTKNVYIYVKSMPLITKLLLMLLKVSYYISVV